ncbi:MAG: PIN domain nuclease [Nocardiopsaceae bacterium]|nr:PIN domain nuclease [Nocardiopsaceae bacterium]
MAVTWTGRRYLIDKSALARMRVPAVAQALRPLFESGALVTCSIIDLEILYSARNQAEYEQVLEQRKVSYDLLPITQDVCDRAVAVQRLLAEKSRHRGASLPDLLIAACAEAHDATVVHYDADYELIAAVTGQPVQWAVPRGTIP